MLSRRGLLAASSAMFPAALLAACANAPTPSQIQADAQAISAGASEIIAKLAAAGVTVSADILANVNKAVADIVANAQGVSSALGQSASPLIQTILNDGGVIANLLAPFFPAAPAVYSVVSAIVALAQSMLSTLGVVAAPRAVVAGPKLIPYSAAAARDVLKG